MLLELNLQPTKKIYFISDLHLGAPNYEASLVREQKIIRFLESVEKDAQAIFLVGDTFDFWFEYKHVVPKYFIRFLSKLIQLKEKGIDIFIFTGNHDLWINDYLKKEVGAHIFHEKIELQLISANSTKIILVAHGDGLGPGDKKYKFLKKFFSNPICKWLFRWLHPDIGMKIAQLWSRHSFTDPSIEVFHGEDREWLIQYCKRKLTEKHYDYFVMGHRHLPMNIDLNEKSAYINLGDWIVNYNYAELDGEEMKLIKFDEK
ncbi:MAG TPA: UDP-2,3-diacylglucosamine diphosphatase [Chitinophagales bacterium]|nr:UDP-2,3-diacylglucosamine diphosphatase [Chitinophagales bacterium]